ncbi:MAG: hypothetical protein HZB39_04040 [Planctomycetes bacterium]|nr:hypothetical protein [Planctomycetota bacterium]
MIRLARDRTAVPPAFTGKGRVANEKKLCDQLPTSEFTFDDGVWKKAKAQLSAESRDKCAYCESPTKVVAHGDVEHFRPKSKYWWLAYCLDNYSYSCQVCNQVHKSDEFPVGKKKLAAPKQPVAGSLAPDPVDATAVADFATRCAAEKPKFLDPYAEEVESYFAWRADDVLKEVEMLPRAKSGAKRTRALATIDGLGLNREELRKVRYETFAPVALLASLHGKLGAADQATLLDALADLLDDAMPYAAMKRWFVREQWKLPVP